MKQHIRFYAIESLWQMPMLLFLLVIYLGGTVIGAFAGIWREDSQEVQQIVLHLIQTGTQTAPVLHRLATAWCTTMTWFLLCILSGLLVPAVLFCSAIIALRGFFLSFSVTVLMAAMGGKGVALAMITIGVGAVVSVPCLLLTGAAVLDAAADLQRGQRRRFFYALRRHRNAIAICAVLSMLFSALRVLLEIVLLQWVIS